MNKPGLYIVFFDLDKTITTNNSGAILIKEARRTGLMSKKSYLRALYLSLLYKLRLRESEQIMAEMATWLKGCSISDYQHISKRIVEEQLIPSIRPAIIEEIKQHRLNGAEIAILSSALADICEGVGSFLKVDTVISTKLESHNGLMTGKTIGEFCFEEQKRTELLSHCAKQNYKSEEAYYYGDSISDIYALESVGNPVCVEPDKKLLSIADKRSWRII